MPLLILLKLMTNVMYFQRFYHHLELKSKDPDAAVPPLDETLKKITECDLELLAESKSIIDAFHRHFELKENPKLKKSTRRFLREKPSGSDEGDADGDVSDAQALNSIEGKPAVLIEKIGDLTPVQDFVAMMSRRDSPEWVGKAIEDMKRKIFELVKSHEGDNYPKAVEFLVALRKGCILEQKVAPLQEPKQFNDFLRSLCKFCQEENIDRLCELLASKELSLIPKSEAIDSDVTDDEAGRFLMRREPKDD
ncbi:hypothetical protein Patl1_00269 [Pistacia atlantica]|uniref:Uncharacterized protein n=1 Tax=Pistacia atlantica TaxID=434234 RepID=A0ACC1C9W9_9ROSI|nr:hypothetical protein Patl1_00269 [Pistacia atlantica]